MSAGKCLWRTRGYQSTPPAVRGVLFTPDAASPDLLVTFGVTHIRFWKPEPLDGDKTNIDGVRPTTASAAAAAAAAAAVAATVAAAATGGMNTKDSGEVRVMSAAAMAAQHAYKPWKSRAGRFSPLPVDNVLAAVFLPPASPAVRKRAARKLAATLTSEAREAEQGAEGGVGVRSGDGGGGARIGGNTRSNGGDAGGVLRSGCTLITGGSKHGALLVWSGGDGSSPARAAPGSRHCAAISALALSADRRRLLSGDAAGKACQHYLSFILSSA